MQAGRRERHHFRPLRRLGRHRDQGRRGITASRTAAKNPPQPLDQPVLADLRRVIRIGVAEIAALFERELQAGERREKAQRQLGRKTVEQVGVDSMWERLPRRQFGLNSPVIDGVSTRPLTPRPKRTNVEQYISHGFDFVVEAGLGRGHRDFRAIRLHTLPASRPASQIWRGAQADDQVEDRPAYKGMLASGALDRCGVTLLAGKAVGAPFVGAVAATLAVSEVLRLLQGGTVHEVIDLDLKAPEYRSAVPTAQDYSTLNPGYVPV